MAHSLESAAGLYRQALRDAVRRHATLFMCEGVLLVLAGVLAVIYPLVTSATIAVPLGWLLIATAALQGLVLFAMRPVPQFVIQLLSVVLALTIGFMLLRDPQQARHSIIVLVITYLMLQGFARLLFGITIRPLHHWLWVTLSGAFGVLLSMLLLAALPDPATWLVGLLVGLQLAGEGVAIALLAWDRKQSTSA